MTSSEVLDKIGEISHKVAIGSYIFRGETRLNLRVSSRLYRECQPNWKEGWDIEWIQTTELYDAKRFTDEKDDLTILTEIQHYGGVTNLIDFTTDYLIALFFACDGDHQEDGRLIFLNKYSMVRAYLHRPNSPPNRVAAQKSIFVRPPLGYIEDEYFETLTIPRHLKEGILDYIRNAHGIYTGSIYNDLHGFIRDRAIHREAKEKFYEGLTHYNNDEYRAAIESYTGSLKLRPRVDVVHNNRGAAHIEVDDIRSAREDFDNAIALNSRNAHARFNRGVLLLSRSRWEEARTDLNIARELSDIREMFRNEYKSAEEFQKRYNVVLPEDIVRLLEWTGC